MRNFYENEDRATYFYSFTRIFINVLCILCFVLTELSDCELQTIMTGCAAVPTTPGVLVDGSNFNICGNRTTRITPPPPPHVILPQILPPVEIHSPQLNLIVQAGDTIYLPCAVQNLGDNQLLWRHRNNIIIGNHYVPSFDPRRIRLLEEFTLELSRIIPEDAGSYECLITTTLPMLSVVHTVTIVDPPSLALEPDTGSVIVTEDESFRIGCIPRGNPLPTISWSKRDGRIPLDPHLLRNYYITIENATRNEAGLYICKASNQIGAPVFGSIFVRVLHIPEVTLTTRRAHGGERYPTELICNVRADPRAEVHWLFKQAPIKYTPRVYTEVRGREHRLILNPVRGSDFGMYTCMANNSFGFDARHIELTGVPKQPNVTKWRISSCIPNSYQDERRDNYRQKRLTQSQNRNELPRFDAPVQSLLSTTLTSPDCSIQMTLFWVVESYSPLIDYQLTFRVTTPHKMASAKKDHGVSNRGDQPGHLDGEDEFEEEEEGKHAAWRIVTIPADPSLSFIHSKAFTTHGIMNNSIFEGGLKARNKWGWSTLSKMVNLTIASEIGPAPRRTDYNASDSTDAVIILINAGQRTMAQLCTTFICVFILSSMSVFRALL